MTETVRYGAPITTAQAAGAVLRMLHTPLVGDVNLDPSPGYTIARIKKDCYDMLSSGEKRLVDIAYSIWRSSDTEGASIGAIGGLDRDSRRKVLQILAYLHLGHDLTSTEMQVKEWVHAFEGGRHR